MKFATMINQKQSHYVFRLIDGVCDMIDPNDYQNVSPENMWSTITSIDGKDFDVQKAIDAQVPFWLVTYNRIEARFIYRVPDDVELYTKEELKELGYNVFD